MKPKKNLTTAAMLLLFAHAHTQTLTCESTCPKGGELSSVRTCSPVVHTAGKDQLWDFSKPVAAGPAPAVTYLPANATPASSLYPQADIVRTQSYGDFSGSVYLQTGTDGVKLAAASDATVNAQLMMLPMPFTMGSTHTETNVTKYKEGSDVMESTRTRSLSGVGTGTVILPCGTFNDVVRIAGYITESITRNGIEDKPKVYANINYYYSEKIPHPLLYSESKWEDGPVDYGPTVLFISDIPVSLEEISSNKSQNLVCIPNPASETLKVTSTDVQPGRIQVIDLNGKIMLDKPFYNGTKQIDTVNFPKGIYAVEVTQGVNVHRTRFVVCR